ncbi:MAG: PKD domain-containing protein [Bacteroidota bacterium]
MLYRRRLPYAVLLLIFQICLHNISSAQLDAAFSSNVIEGCSPLLVQFADNSTGPIDSWEWSLGLADQGCNTGPISTEQNPARIFTEPGLYCICLTIEDTQGNTDTECQMQMIEVFGTPTAMFSGDNLIGCAPLVVNFSDLSIPGTGNIVSWQWDLNNGQCQGLTGQNVSCTYTQPGSYDITLIVTDDNGCMDFVTLDDYIVVSEEPESGFTADVFSACDPPLTVNFSHTISPVNNVTFFWDFGDNNTSTLPNPMHTYTTEGDFDVSLIATNSITGCADTLLVEDYIAVGNAVNFIYSPLEGCEDLTVSFTDVTAGNSSNWQWDFGDGVGTSTDQNPTYTFTDPGCYFVSLTADTDNCSGTRTTTNCIEVFGNPTVSYNIIDPESCDLPHTTSFNGFSDIGTQWFWDFGDSTGTSTLQNPTYTYTEFGSYPITLTVTSPDGCSNSAVLDTVLIVPLDVTIQPSVIEGCAPLPVDFAETNNSSTAIVDWQWDFGNMMTASGPNTTTTYADTGTYTVTLITTNMMGCTDTSETIVEAGMQLPVDFSADPLIECAENEIDFSSITQGDVDEWFWEFGDGGTSTEPNPNYMYGDTGRFEVCLTIFNNGCPSMECKPDYIQILPPIAEFTPIYDCGNPFTVFFEDNSIGADTWFWQFDLVGDPTLTSMDQSPTFTYSSVGTYTVNLTVTNNLTGCSYETQQDIIVSDPEALFTVDPTTGCAPFSPTITNNSVDASSFMWTAPGATIDDPTAAEPVITYENGGNYSNIKLVITDPNGCLDSLEFTGNIFVDEVYPGFEFPVSAGCNPLTVQFTDTSSSFGSPIVSWFWEFGDDSTSMDQNPTHTYVTNGAQDVQLTVTNANGCIDSVLISEAVIVSFPSPNFFVDTVACTGQSILFDNDTGGFDPVTYLWDFGDTNFSTDPNPTHSYANEGVYTVCLTATDANGCVDIFCRDDAITVVDPVPNFVADTLTGTCPPLTVNFQDLSTNAVEWLWDFGDGSAPVSGPNPQHIYTEPGSFDVCLTVTGVSGCQESICFPDYISLDGPQGSFDLVTPLSGCAPLEVTFYGSGTDIAVYTWDNGGGQVVFHPSTEPVDSVTFIYNEAGTFFPVLVVEDAQGCQRTFPYPDPVIVHDLTVDFNPEDTISCDDLTIDYFTTVSSSIDPVNYAWQFPGGMPDTSNLANPQITYSGPGTYDAILYVDNGMCFDTIARPDVVHIPEVPIADFSFAPLTGCNPLSVNFTDLSNVVDANITDWIWDFGTGDSAFVQNPMYTFQDTGTFNITLTSFSNFGCEDSTMQSIIVEASPVAVIGPEQTICQGDFAQLNVSGGVGYQWSPTGSLSCSNCPDPMASPMDTTNYSVTVFAANGCTDVATVQVNVIPFPVPEVAITEDTTVCAGTFVQLNVSSATPNVSYFWDTSVPGLSCYENCFNPFAAPFETTTYIVTTVGEGGCATVDSITVNVIDDEMDIAGPDRTICNGGEVQLSISDGNNPMWGPAIGLSCANCPDPIVNPVSDQDYWVRITTDFGCIVTDTIRINVIDIEELDAGRDTAVCVGDEVQLSATGFGDILWSPTNTLDDPTSFTPFATPDESTVYHVSFTNDECVVNDSVLVEVRTKAEIFADDASLCPGDTIQIFATGFAETYQWSPAIGLSGANLQEPLAFPSQSTEYMVVGSIGSCEPDTANMLVTVFDDFEVETRGVTSFFPGQEVEVSASVDGQGSYSYSWSPEDFLNCTNCANAIATPDSAMVYTVMVTDENGCSKTAQQVLRLKLNCTENLIAVPNAFTPNNDGLNDVLYVRGSTIASITVFRIFDRWGNLMFESNNISTGWDGTFEGEKVNPGVYVYYVEAPCALDGSPILKKGNVTVIR